MKQYKNYFIIGGVLLLIILTFVSYMIYDVEDEDLYLAEEITTTKEKESTFYVDIKGAVKNPGVYEVTSEERVTHAIEKAGGLTKTGNVSNINLSKKLTSEMVIYVYTNNEIKKGTNNINCNTTCNCEVVEVNNCFPEETNSNGKININTSNLEELMKLTGIGESKAMAIIKYREENGYFESIEDLTNVSGIGLTTFEKFKDDITV